MGISKEAFVAAAAIIAGVFSLVGLIVSKELKVSEFRQQWIDELRKDISKYLSSITTLYKLAEAKLDSYKPPRDDFDEHMCSDFREKHEKEYLELNETNNRIFLRLNPDELDHKQLINIINENTNLFYDKKCKREDIFRSIEFMKIILDQSQKILKDEWKQVKKGEYIFRFVKYSLIVLSVALFLGLVAYGGYVVYQWAVT